MARRDLRPLAPSLSFFPVFVPAVQLRRKPLPQPRPLASPPYHHRTRLVPRRPRCALLAAGTAEEELFIRRHSAATANSPAEKPSAAPTKPNPPDEGEEHFDFVQDPDPPPAPTISKPREEDVSKGSPSIGVDATQGDHQGEKKVPATEVGKQPPLANTPKTSAKRPVRIMIPPGLHGFGGRLRKETSKLFTESQLVSHVRMPTRRATVLFAWELALVLALLMLLRAGVSSTLRWIHNRLNATRGLKSNIPYEASVFECMQRPLEFLSLFTVGTALAEAVSRPLAAIGLLRHIRTLRELGIIISAAWFLLRWIDRIRSRFSVAKGIDKAQVDATSRIATVVTFVASLLISLDTIGINVQTVLAFGGIGGVAIGFAGREIISNFFGGFMIYVTRPFSVGEWIRSIEEEELNGTVEDIGWYLTRVRTWDKRPLYIPNSRFSTLIVENGSRMDNRRVLHTLHLRHEDMPVVPTIVAAIESLLMNHQELDPRQHRLAYVDSFGEYSVRIWVSCYTKSVFLYDFRRVQQDILVKCYEIIRTNGAKLATINTRDVRPGADTDRYGPFGSAASFSAATPGIQTPQRASNLTPVNSDVPGSRQYGSSVPLVRFHNIESGVDLSRVDQPATPNGVPAGTTLNTSAQPGAAGGAVSADGKVPGAFNHEAGPQRSTSAAAVAAAAAALAAARRNAARIEDNERSLTQQSRMGQESVDGVSVPPETTIAGSTPSGQMKITAAKPSRSAQGQPLSNATMAQTAEVLKRGDTKDDIPTEGSQLSSGDGEDLPAASKSLEKNQNNSTPVGEMKISKARKPLQATQASGDGEGYEGIEKSVTPEPGDQSETTELPRTSTELKPITTANPPQMKISADKTSAAGATGQPVSAAKAALDTSQKESNSPNGTLQSKQALKDDIIATPKAGANRQTSPSASGEMKISKARKPVPAVPVNPESDGKGTGQSSKNATPTKGSETILPQSSTTLEDLGNEN